MFGLGAGELFLVMVLALIFIGPKKLPELAKGMGKGLREFNKAKNELMNNMQEGASDNVEGHQSSPETSSSISTEEYKKSLAGVASEAPDKPSETKDSEKENA